MAAAVMVVAEAELFLAVCTKVGFTYPTQNRVSGGAASISEIREFG